MVTSIARQSVIIKCNQKTSVLLGNYEFYYLAGLLKNLYQMPLHAQMTPKEMIDAIHANEAMANPSCYQEEYMLQIVKTYLPLAEYDDQMKELFAWGEAEKDYWKMTTSYK